MSKNALLNAREEEMEKGLHALAATSKEEGQAAPSTGRLQHPSGPSLCTLAEPCGTQRKLYSDAVRSVENNKNKRHKLIVTSKLKESGESIKTTLKSKINPATIKVGVKTLRNLKDGRVLIETGSKQEVDKLSAEINSHCGHALEAKVSQLRNPTLIIFNIPKDITKENAEEIIRTQNTELALKEEDIKPKFTHRTKKNNKNLTVEVSSEARKKRVKQHIKLGWVICNIEDYINPIRCYKCSRFNHKHTNCQGEETCPLSAGKHKLKECTIPARDFKCINCINHNKYSKEKICENHLSLNKSCPSLNATIKKYIQNTDY